MYTVYYAIIHFAHLCFLKWEIELLPVCLNCAVIRTVADNLLGTVGHPDKSLRQQPFQRNGNSHILLSVFTLSHTVPHLKTHYFLMGI